MKRTIINTTIGLFFSTVIIFSACDDTITNLDDIPASNVSYSQHIQPIFNISCAISGCHDDASAAGNVVLSSWSNTTLNPLIIVPGNAENSILVWSIEGRPGSSPMPPIYGTIPPLSSKQITGIRTWINEGAKPN